MKKNIFGRKFGRDTNQRKSLFRGLITSLIMEESIKTTLEKAKAIKGDVDKFVNKAKKEEERMAIQLLQKSLNKDAMDKLIKEIGPRFSDRNSGYTRIIKIGKRFSDNANVVLMEWVVKKEVKSKDSEVKELPSGKTEEKKADKKTPNRKPRTRQKKEEKK